jgi:hypothetical protein
VATAKWFGPALAGQFSNVAARRVDWGTDTIKVTLHTSSYTPTQDTHDFHADLTNEVATGDGYTTGGVTLGSKTAVYDAASNTLRLDAADPSWTFTALKTFRYAVIWKDTTVSATSPLLGWIDFGADIASNGVFTIILPTDGILRAVAS